MNSTRRIADKPGELVWFFGWSLKAWQHSIKNQTVKRFLLRVKLPKLPLRPNHSGLLSAAKAVGMGAGVLVDAADAVVAGGGKFEELVVCSQEVAASTVQLVVASKVKAK